MFVPKTGVQSGETCRRIDVNGDEDVFSCPHFLEPPEKKFCCGLTAQDKHCCESNEKSRDPDELITTFFDKVIELLFGGTRAIMITISVTVIICALIIWGCVYTCCLPSRIRQRRGQVLSL